jgi:hypothetical protein
MRPLLLDHVEDHEGSCQRDRVADIPLAHAPLARRIDDLNPPEHTRERQPCGDRFGDRP